MNGEASAMIIGRVTKDARTGTMDNGRAYAFFTVAVNKPEWTDKNGNKVQPPATFLEIAAFGPAAQYAAIRAKRGVGFYGSCNINIQQDKEFEKDGQKIIYRNNAQFEVINGHFGFFELQKANGDKKQQAAPAQQAPAKKPAQAAYSEPETDPEADFEPYNDDDTGAEPSVLQYAEGETGVLPF